MLLSPLDPALAGETITDDTGATITPPDGIEVTPNVGGVPEWHFTATPGAPDMPSLAGNKSILCALGLSGSAGVGGGTDPAYLKREVEDQMQVVGAHDPPPAFEPSPYRFLMVTEWNPTRGVDAGDTLFLFHAESDRAYAYLSCFSKPGDAAKARPLFRKIWNGIKLPN